MVQQAKRQTWDWAVLLVQGWWLGPELAADAAVAAERSLSRFSLSFLSAGCSLSGFLSFSFRWSHSCLLSLSCNFSRLSLSLLSRSFLSVLRSFSSLLSLSRSRSTPLSLSQSAIGLRPSDMRSLSETLSLLVFSGFSLSVWANWEWCPWCLWWWWWWWGLRFMCGDWRGEVWVSLFTEFLTDCMLRVLRRIASFRFGS